jgi:hypothetical protein
MAADLKGAVGIGNGAFQTRGQSRDRVEGQASAGAKKS